MAHHMKTLQLNGCEVFLSHSLEKQISGQLKAEFVLTDLYGDRDREGYGVLR